MTGEGHTGSGNSLHGGTCFNEAPAWMTGEGGPDAEIEG